MFAWVGHFSVTFTNGCLHKAGTSRIIGSSVLIITLNKLGPTISVLDEF